MEIKRKKYVQPELSYSVVELQQMITAGSTIGKTHWPEGGQEGDGFYDTGGVGKLGFGQDDDNSFGFGLWDEDTPEDDYGFGL